MKYALITAARNEEEFIGRTIDAVISQSVLPRKWIIVSDGSTDNTDQIVKEYSEKNGFIELIKRDEGPIRSFASKAKAIELAYKKLEVLDFDFIGNLDADITFGVSYYKIILDRFADNPKLGIAGGIRSDYSNGRFVELFYNKLSIAGAFQLFRRQCYESIGGYMALKYGGMDAVAEISARMHGWEVESFVDVKVLHHRSTGSAAESFLGVRFRYGAKYYVVGYHPLFFTLMVIRRMVCKGSYLIGGPFEMFGYAAAALRGEKRPVSDRFVAYLRSEQLFRLRKTLLFPKTEIASSRKE